MAKRKLLSAEQVKRAEKYLIELIKTLPPATDKKKMLGRSAGKLISDTNKEKA
ncbi:hypothetical protein [Klebsiella pneumoniae]|jgi:hypothetical protein|uniref:hypothetical protein n=1 Tax=Klebsiella pneumoniae TaxID=573 RepID=UPI00273005FD|nr:hypothetical protein [Klebsiella pneumoniae]MDP1465866.1 hypothetical protein [Klebsiella pneumoniae]